MLETGNRALALIARQPHVVFSLPACNASAWRNLVELNGRVILAACDFYCTVFIHAAAVGLPLAGVLFYSVLLGSGLIHLFNCSR